MELYLYVNKSDKKVVDKDIQQLGDSLSCSVYGECSILEPDLLLTYDSARRLAQCNYIYIPDFGRYYYKTDLVLVSGNRCILSATVDPLMSFKNGIYNLNCNVARCENYKTTMIPDSNIMTFGTETEVVSFSRAFEWSNNHSYILTVLGG